MRLPQRFADRVWIFRQDLLLDRLRSGYDDGRSGPDFTWPTFVRHGRFAAKLRSEGPGRRREKELGLEWALLHGTSSTALSVTFDSPGGETDVMFHAAVYRVFSVFVSVNGLPERLRLHLKKPDGSTLYEDRRIGWSFHDGTVWWEHWVDPHSWHRSTPKWQHGNFNVADRLFGRHKFESVTREVHAGVPIPMPEGSYPATIRLTYDTWTRERQIFGYPLPKVRWGCSIDVDPDPVTGKPVRIPYPGKGGGSSGTDNLSASARTVADAVTVMVGHVLKERIRRGRSITAVGR